MKHLAKILAFFAQATASFCKNCDHNIGFWEKRQFFRRKLQKSQKIVIITSTPVCSGISWFEVTDVCNVTSPDKCYKHNSAPMFRVLLATVASETISRLYLRPYRGQGDQMSLWKNHPKSSPTHFCSQLTHNSYCGKSSPNVWVNSVI
jgi:hypothetical protein